MMALQSRINYQFGKPTNLANSEVYKMLQEEEATWRTTELKRVAWPPPPELNENGDLLTNQPSYQPTAFTQAQFQPQGTPQAVTRVPPTFSPPPPAPYQPIHFEPPKATVTLLSSAPVRQPSPPIFASQPTVASAKGGVRSRGDAKWPPEPVKQAAEAENQARIALAKGPACRPRLVRKDYSTFFAQHALNPTYTSYRAPPGTQHYIEDGTSNL